MPLNPSTTAAKRERCEIANLGDVWGNTGGKIDRKCPTLLTGRGRVKKKGGTDVGKKKRRVGDIEKQYTMGADRMLSSVGPATLTFLIEVVRRDPSRLRISRPSHPPWLV